MPDCRAVLVLRRTMPYKLTAQYFRHLPRSCSCSSFSLAGPTLSPGPRPCLSGGGCLIRTGRGERERERWASKVSLASKEKVGGKIRSKAGLAGWPCCCSLHPTWAGFTHLTPANFRGPSSGWQLWAGSVASCRRFLRSAVRMGKASRPRPHPH